MKTKDAETTIFSILATIFIASAILLLFFIIYGASARVADRVNKGTTSEFTLPNTIESIADITPIVKALESANLNDTVVINDDGYGGDGMIGGILSRKMKAATAHVVVKVHIAAISTHALIACGIKTASDLYIDNGAFIMFHSLQEVGMDEHGKRAYKTKDFKDMDTVEKKLTDQLFNKNCAVLLSSDNINQIIIEKKDLFIVGTESSVVKVEIKNEKE